MIWSPYQEDIFTFLKNEKGSAVVTAVAGSGKTTTIVEAANRLDGKVDAKFVAFSKRIQLALADRLPDPKMAQTLHAMGYAGWNAYDALRGRVKIDSNKMRDLLDELIPSALHRDYKWPVLKLVSLAKQIGLVPRGYDAPLKMAQDSYAEWMNLIDFYDVDFPRGAKVERAIEYASKALRKSIDTADDAVDFDYMIYLPVIHRAKLPQFDVLFVDEAQDVNETQRVMLHEALKPGGRLIAVGDPYQAVFGFRGADVHSVDHIRNEFHACDLPLTVSYRCPKDVVQFARQYVPHIQPCENAVQGFVDPQPQACDVQTTKALQPSDVILCRNTAPLVDLAYTLIRRGVGATVLGRDVAKGLVSLVKSLRAYSVGQLKSYLEAYYQNECRRLSEEGKEYKIAQVTDRVDTIKVFLRGLRDDAKVDQVTEQIEAVFSEHGEKKQLLTLSTIHKAKGLEWDRVWILDWSLLPSCYARQEWQLDQERNLQYVACTRARRELRFLSSE